MLIQLTYASRTTGNLGPADIKDILAASQRNNARLGVTGALCLNNGIFLQQLEGDREIVNALYHRILLDSRHRDPAILDFSEIHARRFGVTPKVALFTEYKYTDSTFRFGGAFGPVGGFDGTYRAHQLFMGLSYHF